METSPLQQQRERYWQQLAPSFARLDHKQSWSADQLAAFADHLLRLKQTRTEIYLTTWDPPSVEAGPPRRDYAQRIADQMAYLVHERGCDHVRTYCMSNELTLEKWGTLRWELPTFADYHRELRRAFDDRDLRIELLASDASPHSCWGTLDWCMQHMDDITGVYGAHHYFNEHPVDDPALYHWFLKQCQNAAGAARRLGKDFIVGEFGAAQNHGQLQREGARLDVCRYFGTPAEPMAGLQIADGILAMINASVYACGYWTFADMADPVPPKDYWNQWGIVMQHEDRIVPRSIYGAVGLLAHHFRGSAEVLSIQSDDPAVRAAAIRRGADTYAIAIVNRHDAPTPVALTGPARKAVLQQYVYEPAQLKPGPLNIVGLPEPLGVLRSDGGSMSLEIPGQSLTVLTNSNSTMLAS